MQTTITMLEAEARQERERAETWRALASMLLDGGETYLALVGDERVSRTRRTRRTRRAGRDAGAVAA
ncbi:MAG: hypothetical protein M3Q49_07890 [Actinomycetota bacterium]|nr:hypothetical protein [Actinomycetota bacterium]